MPGADLTGIYYMKNIREAMERDKTLDRVKSAVVLEAGPLGLEMVTALCHRGIETHLVDPSPWALSMATDPDIVKPVEDSWIEMGAKLHFNTKLEAILGDADGAVRAVQTSDGEIPCQLARHRDAQGTQHRARRRCRPARSARAGGFIVDESMATSVKGVWAAGDCIEVPHGVSNVPIQGLSGSHAYSQGKVAGRQRRRRHARLPTGLRPLGTGRRQVDDRRGLVQRDPGHGAGHPLRHGRGPGHLAGPLLPGHAARSRSSCWPSPARCD